MWRGHVPILTLGDIIHWQTPPDDCCTPGREPHMAVLQHELQHVLEFATGELSTWRYAFNPRNWGYDFELKPDSRWTRLRRRSARRHRRGVLAAGAWT